MSNILAKPVAAATIKLAENRLASLIWKFFFNLIRKILNGEQNQGPHLSFYDSVAS